MSLHQPEPTGYPALARSTSANGAMLDPPPVFQVGPRLVARGTTGTGTFEGLGQEVLDPPPQTSSGLPIAEVSADGQESTARAINELHRLTSLTWEQLADLFQVARRSLHFWASGKPLNGRNEARLRRVLAVLRKTDRGSAPLNRAMLLQDRDGVVPLDLLVREEFDLFVELVGVGPGRRRLTLTPLSEEAQAARRPPPPDQLVGALQDRLHVEKGKLLSSTPIRPRREK